MTRPEQKDSKQVVVELTMPVDQAREYIWQGTRAPREPMGKLLDSKQLDWSDLAWAAQVGYEPKFREAARTLLAFCIGRPISLRFGPEVVEGSRYLEEIELDSLMDFSAYSGLAIGLAIWIIVSMIQVSITYVIPQVAAGHIIALAIAVIFFSLIVGWLAWYFYRLMKQQFQHYRTFKAGRDGEDRVVEILRASLDSRWTIFRNLRLPNRKGDIDVVLVDPAGVWAVEVKTYRNAVRAKGENWQVNTKNGWSLLDSNPSKQAKNNAVALRDFLQSQGINIRYVEPAVALGEEQPVINFESARPPVWLPPTISEKVTNLRTENPPNDQEMARVADTLTTRAKEQIAIEEAKHGK